MFEHMFEVTHTEPMPVSSNDNVLAKLDHQEQRVLCTCWALSAWFAAHGFVQICGIKTGQASLQHDHDPNLVHWVHGTCGACKLVSDLNALEGAALLSTSASILDCSIL